jgi:hypothetical protein
MSSVHRDRYQFTSARVSVRGTGVFSHQDYQNILNRRIRGGGEAAVGCESFVL